MDYLKSRLELQQFIQTDAASQLGLILALEITNKTNAYHHRNAS